MMFPRITATPYEGAMVTAVAVAIFNTLDVTRHLISCIPSSRVSTLPVVLMPIPMPV